VEGDVDAARHRDLPAEQPLGRGGVVGEDVADVPRLPAGVADGVPGVADLEGGELVDVLVDDGGEPAQQPGPLRGSQPSPGGERVVGPLDQRVGLLRRGELDLGERLRGRRVEDGVRGGQWFSSEPLEATPPLPVGHGGAEGGQLDVGHVRVVVDDVVPESGPGDLRPVEGVPRVPEGVGHLRTVRSVGVPDERWFQG
jgi:hypothetical protein